MLHKSVTSGFLRFSNPPELGHIHVYNNQIYTFIGLSASGNFSSLRWATHCAVCGVAMEVTSTLSSRGMNRRCDKHKKAWVKVKNEDAHALSQGWIEASARPAKQDAPAKPVTGARAHPLYPVWQAYVLAVPERERRGLLNWDQWLEKREREEALD